jgi:pimeloyl-ACP methyl ester carboxylesterase
MLTKQFLALSPSFAGSDQTHYQAAYIETGGSGPAILMLHGFMGDATCWEPVMQKLQPYRCVSLDLLGFGTSSKPAIRYDIATEVAFVRQVVEQLKLDPCYVLGHSFGAWVGTAYTLKYSHSVSGLILAAAAGIRDDSFCSRYSALRPLLWSSPLVDWVLRLAMPLAGIVGKRAGMETISWYRRSLMEQPVACSFILDRLRPDAAIDTVEKDIHRLQVPTLVVTGDCDDTIPFWHSQTYVQEIPTAQLAVIPGACHALPQRHAPEMTDLILKFLITQLENHQDDSRKMLTQLPLPNS